MKLSDLHRVKELQDRRYRLLWFRSAGAKDIHVSLFGSHTERYVAEAAAPAINQAIVAELARVDAELSGLGVTVDEVES